MGGREKEKTSAQTGGHIEVRIRWTALSDKETSAHWKLNVLMIQSLTERDGVTA